MGFHRMIITFVFLFFLFSLGSAKTIRVPADKPTIQSAVNDAQNGDVVLIAPGIYEENIEWKNKTITLASHFLNTQDTSYIAQTIIDGSDETVLLIEGAGPETKIVGLTIRNGDDGISTDSKIQILHNYFTRNVDAIDYEGGGGLCEANRFEKNRDDAIDLDGSCEVIIQNNLILNNEDDGIEIRLHPYQGPELSILIRNNIISGNEEDGIQFIDYSSVSHRVFRIERNLIANSAMAAVGCMGNRNTRENYEAADIPERIFLINNTIVGNTYGVTGGDNMVIANNIFSKTEKIAVKKVDGNSIVTHNLFWENGTDLEQSHWQKENTLFKDPALNASHHLTSNSPCIDAGTATLTWKGQPLFTLPTNAYTGPNPDLGAFEFQPAN